MADLDNLKALLDIVNSIIAPINATLNKQNEALVESATQLNTLVDLFQTEPTRHTIIEKLRDALENLEEEVSKNISEHNTICKERHAEQCVLGDRRGQDILREATSAMKAIVESHNTQVGGMLNPVKELKDKFDKLLWAIGIATSIGMAMFGYLAYALSHLPTPAPIPGAGS